MKESNFYTLIRAFIEILLLLSSVPLKIIAAFCYSILIFSNVFSMYLHPNVKEVRKLTTFELFKKYSIFSFILPKYVYTQILEKKIDLFSSSDLDNSARPD